MDLLTVEIHFVSLSLRLWFGPGRLSDQASEWEVQSSNKMHPLESSALHSNAMDFVYVCTWSEDRRVLKVAENAS